MTESIRRLDPLAFPLRGSQLIEASAGTGKTFTLALLYLRLILGHGNDQTAFDRPLTPSEILVVTFTEAAAEELRERIRGRLVEAAVHFRRPDLSNSTDDPLERLRQSYPPQEWPSCAWRLEVAAESMDEARISTIHGWCNRVLVEQAFDTRGLFDRQLITDTEDLLAEVVRDYWRIQFYDVSEEAAGIVLDAIGSPEKLLAELRNLMGTASEGVTFKGRPIQVEQLTPYLQRALEKADLERRVRAHWRDHWEEIESHLLELRPSLNGSRHGSANESKYRQVLDAIHAWAAEGAEAPGKLGNFAAGRFTFKKGQPHQQEKSLVAFTLLREYLDLSDEAGQSNEVPLRFAVLAHALHWVRQVFDQRMKRRAEMGFDDLLHDLDRALDPSQAPEAAGRLAENLRTRFPVALIDEFQDTDPVQYRIFDRIYNVQANCPETGLFMIGDPKQSIYGFRGADIHTYLEARRATTGRHFTLTRNFRSTRGVVAACNALFEHAERHERGAFRFRESENNPVPYITVDAQGRDETLYLLGADAPDSPAPVNPMNFWHFAPENPDELALGASQYRRQAAASTASQIVAWLEAAAENKAGFGQNGQITQPLKPADMAILVRTTTEARAIRAALKERRVPSVYLSDKESVFSTAEARDMLHWLRACAQPQDERLVRAALGTNTLDIPLEQLALWLKDELAWESQMQTFAQLHQCWQEQGILATLYDLLQAFDLPARLMKKPEGERQLTNILHLAEWLQQASTELDGEQALIRHLAQYREVDDKQQVLRLESDADRVQVITIHKSKGLEYPLVLLPFISSWKEIDGNTRQVPYRHADRPYQEIAGKNTFEEAWKQANDQRISEDMRLLYVALTRARHAVWLGVAPLANGNAKKPQIERSALGYLLNGGSPVEDATSYRKELETVVATSEHIGLAESPAADQACLAPREATKLQEARPSPASGLCALWWIASYSAIRFQSENSSNASSAAKAAQPAEPNIFGPDSESETARDDQQDEERRLAHAPPTGLPDGNREVLCAQNVLHRLPAGASWGTFLHALLEWAAAQQFSPKAGQPRRGFSAIVTENTSGRQEFHRFCQRRRIPAEFIAPLWGWLTAFVQARWPLDALNEERALVLQQIEPAQCAVELEFMIESHQVDAAALDRLVRNRTLGGAGRPQARSIQLNGLLKGFIDLVVAHQGRYYVIDWKSNRLGPTDADYNPASMQAQILSHRYDLQYVLYLVALHRLLKARLPDYDYDRHVGGAIYVFLRGTRNQETRGLFCDRPERALIEELDRLLAQGTPAGQEREICA
ncbi:MAG: exodeoxyribonuclease V subunit beta [Halothiobacillaceae bacterium]